MLLSRIFVTLCSAGAVSAAVIDTAAPRPHATQVPKAAPTLAPREAGSSTDIATSTKAIPTGIYSSTKHIVIDGVTNAHVTIPGKTVQVAIPTCTQTIEPDKNGFVPPGTCGAIWNYYPSFNAAAALACLFGLLVGLHVWQAAAYKKRWCWVIIMAAIWEMMAMIFRATSAKDQQSRGIYLVFQIFILLAPLWVNAFVYMTFGRLVHKFHPSQAVFGLPAATIAAIFVVLDVVSFIIQLIGGSMAGPGTPLADQQRAVHVYMGGIGLQELWIVVFVVLCVSFQLQLSKLNNHGMGFWQTSWGPLLAVLYAALAMITIRIVYRLVEFSGGLGQDNALTTHEAYFYVLETTPMFLALLVFNIVHPGRIISGPGSEMPGLVSTIKGKVQKKKGKELLDDDSMIELE